MAFAREGADILVGYYNEHEDILVNNAAHQASCESAEEISDEEWDATLRTNIHAMFYLTKAPLRHMHPGVAIINR